MTRLGVSLALLGSLLLVWALTGETTSDASVRRIQSRFVAPCCWQDNLATHNSGAAEQLRAEIAAMVAQGKTESEIVDYCVSQYGERILREPRGKKSAVLVVVPFLVLAAGGALLALYLSHARARTSPGPQAATVPPTVDDDFDW